MADTPSKTHFLILGSLQPNCVQLTSSVLYACRKCTLHKKCTGMKPCGSRPQRSSCHQYQLHNLADIPNSVQNLQSVRGLHTWLCITSLRASMAHASLEIVMHILSFYEVSIYMTKLCSCHDTFKDIRIS